MHNNIIMAAGNFGSPMQLLILLVIVILLFGGKRLRSLGGDIGAAIKGFKNSMSPPEEEKEQSKDDLAKIIDANVDSAKVIHTESEKEKEKEKNHP